MKTTLGQINVKKTLADRPAWYCIQKMLAQEVEILGVNEWEDDRMDLMAAHGTVLNPKNLKSKKQPDKGWLWCNTPGGGLVVGLAADRYTVKKIYTIPMHDGGKVFPAPGQKDIEPPRRALAVEYDDRENEKSRAILMFHMVAHVERAGRYRAPADPRKDMHQSDIKAVAGWMEQNVLLDPIAMGDTNWHNLHIPGAIGDYERKVIHTEGRRNIDLFYHTKKKPIRVGAAVTTPSDHNGKVVVYS